MTSRLKLPPISPDAHKYARGSLLVLAGSRRYYGAAVLATLAAERGGAGYVSLATPQSAAAACKAHIVCSPVVEAPENMEVGCLNALGLAEVISGLRHVDALCCGPGLTVHEETAAFVKTVIEYAQQQMIPLLLDADGLNVLAAHPEYIEHRRTSLAAPEASDNAEAGSMEYAPLILTPHKGELARLLAAFAPSNGLEEEEADPVASIPSGSEAVVAQYLAEELKAVVVAKGPTTYVAWEDKLVESAEATPALAKSGTGDVLAGLIASLLAQGLAASEAALAGVALHSQAGLIAEKEKGRRSVTALDVIDALPQALQNYEAEEE